VELVSDFELPQAALERVPSSSTAVLRAFAGTTEEVLASWSGGDGPPFQALQLSDGKRLVIEKGRAGDHLLRHGSHLFHISADAGTLRCTRPDGADRGWERLLLEWVAYSTSILAGLEQLHASAVQTDAGVVAFAAAAGGGKTTLASEFIRNGAQHFSEDALSLALEDGSVVAYPGAPFATIDVERREMAEQLGVVVARFGDELWVAVDDAAVTPERVAALVLLERSVDGPARPLVRRDTDGFFAVRKFAVGFPHLRGREIQRFGVAAGIAESASVLTLEARSDVAPHDLMAAVDEALAEETPR
jgi:hypothetical protein